MPRLAGKVAIITGGASGIGKATARLFVEEGARVCIADVQEDRGRALADELGDAARFQMTNVASEPHVEAVVRDTIEAWGQLDCMFNNAGLGGVVGPIDELPVDEFDTTVSVMLRGVFLGLKHAGRVMRKRGRGSIINSGSIAGMLAGLAPHVYSACKAAVIHLTRSVATELGEAGVRVNCICPGAINTPLVSEFLIGFYGRQDQVKDNMATYQPIRRPGVPDDIAKAALWLATEESSFVNGHALVVDGGLTAGVQWSETPGEWLRVHTPMRKPGPIDT